MATFRTSSRVAPEPRLCARLRAAANGLNDVRCSGEWPTTRSAMGPISYLIVEFPGNKMTGEGFPILVDLVDRGVIRILDLVFVTRDPDGSMRTLQFADLDRDGQLDLARLRGGVVGSARRQRPRRRGSRHRPGLVGRHPDLREPLGDVVHAGAAARRGRARRRRLHPPDAILASLDATDR